MNTPMFAIGCWLTVYTDNPNDLAFSFLLSLFLFLSIIFSLPVRLVSPHSPHFLVIPHPINAIAYIYVFSIVVSNAGFLLKKNKIKKIVSNSYILWLAGPPFDNNEFSGGESIPII